MQTICSVCPNGKRFSAPKTWHVGVTSLPRTWCMGTHPITFTLSVALESSLGTFRTSFNSLIYHRLQSILLPVPPQSRAWNCASIVGVNRTSQVLQERSRILSDRIREVDWDVEDISELARRGSDEFVSEAEGVGKCVGVEGAVLDVASNCDVLDIERWRCFFEQLTVQAEEVVLSDVSSKELGLCSSQYAGSCQGDERINSRPPSTWQRSPGPHRWSKRSCGCTSSQASALRY